MMQALLIGLVKGYRMFLRVPGWARRAGLSLRALSIPCRRSRTMVRQQAAISLSPAWPVATPGAKGVVTPSPRKNPGCLAG